MPRFASLGFGSVRNTNVNGAGTLYLVQTLAGVLYHVFMDTNDDVAFRKSTDNGITWGPTTVVFAGTATNLAVWYDRWSGISGDLIHCAYSESVTDDTLYRTINAASSDALSTQTSIFAGASTAAGGALTIARARGGNVYCRTTIDAGAEGGFFRLPNANVPNGAWDAARTINEALATQDQFILVPGFAADNQDMMLIFWDASSDIIERQVYDDSANSWGVANISTAMVDVPANGATFPHFAAAADLTNSQIIVIAWNGVDTANQDLLGWTVTESAITAFTTSVVLNATDDCGLCAFSLDLTSGVWWAFYGGKSDGSETWNTAVNIYCKASTDSGATWGPETKLSTTTTNIAGLFGIPRYTPFGLVPPVLYMENDDVNHAYCITQIAQPALRQQLGM